MKSFVFILVAFVALACEVGNVEVRFERLNGPSPECILRASDRDQAYRDIILTISSDEKVKAHCLNPGFYILECPSGKIRFLHNDNFQDLEFDTSVVAHHITIDFKNGGNIPQADFDKSKPITGAEPYFKDPSTDLKYPCNAEGYNEYLDAWSDLKCTPRDENDPEYKKRLAYFKDSCQKIKDWNTRNDYLMEFTFYADWHPDEFEEITTTKQRYSGVKSPIPDVVHEYNNTNLRYLMPSLDPCDDNTLFDYTPFIIRRLQGGTGTKTLLRDYICKPQNCSVTWAFATVNSIEYAIKKFYLETYDQIIEVALSAQELIDCVGIEHNVSGKVCDGLPLAWAFDYVFENGIAYRKYYPHINVEDKCRDVPQDQKYFIAGYEKPDVYNKLGLFNLVMQGPTAVTLGLDPEFFQYYRSDRDNGPYFDTAFWRPSVYGVVVEYRQYAVEGQPEYVDFPYFAIESRLRACYSFVYRLPIRESTLDANIAGIGGFAIRPIVADLIPTEEPPSVPPTPTATPTPTPTPEPWFPIYDPFMFGDNSNYATDDDQCAGTIISDSALVGAYLAIRDNYPTKALSHSRCIVLGGVNPDAANQFDVSLSKQVKNDYPVDLWVLGDAQSGRVIDRGTATSLIELAQYLNPKKIVFYQGSLYREGLRDMITWMNTNKDKGYFKNLEYFEVSANFASSVNQTNPDENTVIEISNAIISEFSSFCNDVVNVPNLKTINLAANSWMNTYGSYDTLSSDIPKICENRQGTTVTIDMSTLRTNFPNICSETLSYGVESLTYYNFDLQKDVDQCRYTWNWEPMGTSYGPGPYPRSGVVCP